LIFSFCFFVPPQEFTMPRRTTPQKFRRRLIAIAASGSLAPASAWALDLANSPPGTVESYVAPNVIISLDDSTSMDEKDMVLKDPSKPYNKESNPYTKTRVQVLQEAIQSVFNDKDLLPDKKNSLSLAILGGLHVSPRINVHKIRHICCLLKCSKHNENIGRSPSLKLY